MITDPFADPAPYRASGLQRATCDDCRAVAYVDAQYTGPVRCGQCWRTLAGAAATGRPAPGTPRGVASVRAVIHDPRSAAALAEPAYRVLTPAREPEPYQVPRSAAALARVADENGWTTRLTYALAEETVSGVLVHTLAVRLRAQSRSASCRSAVALWRDGRSTGAVVTPMRKVTNAELVAIVSGQPWVPAQRAAALVGPCPRPACGRPVRWTKTFTPYAHRRPDGEACQPA